MPNSRNEDGVMVDGIEQRTRDGIMFEAAHLLTVANSGGTASASCEIYLLWAELSNE